MIQNEGNNLVNNIHYVHYAIPGNTHGLTAKVVVTNQKKKVKVYNHCSELF
jgi:hypothetical protein